MCPETCNACELERDILQPSTHQIYLDKLATRQRTFAKKDESPSNTEDLILGRMRGDANDGSADDREDRDRKKREEVRKQKHKNVFDFGGFFKKKSKPQDGS